MTDLAFEESGMVFGPFPDGHCFRIEKSRCYLDIKQGVKMVEFVVLRPKPGTTPAIWIVEAKSSSPRPTTQPDFEKYIDDIGVKLANGLVLVLAACLGRHPNCQAEVPDGFRSLDFGATVIRFVLVIKGHPEEWLVPLRDALEQALKPLVKTWAVGPGPVVVLNEELARRYGLILQSPGQ